MRDVHLLYLRKRCADQAFWDFARARPDHVTHPALQELTTAAMTTIGVDEARRVFAYLHGELGMRDDDMPNVRTPVEVITLDGLPMALSRP